MAYIQALYQDADQRMNMYELNNAAGTDTGRNLYPDLVSIKERASAVACLMEVGQIIETPENYRLSRSLVPNLSERVSRMPINRGGQVLFNAPLAPHEKFRTELAPGCGSAFLISAKKVFTAGHCICVPGTSDLITQNALENIRVVFGFHKADANQDKKEFQKSEVFKIKRIISYQYNHLNHNDPDWALLKLDRAVEDIVPIPLSLDFGLSQEIYSLGCPTGTAVKFAGKATVLKMDANKAYGNLDTFGGNSGGPVIDRVSGCAIGIVVTSCEREEYMYDEPHYARTGEVRVIAARITPEMIAAGSHYAGFQKLTAAMRDPFLFLVDQTQSKIKQISDRNSDTYVEYIQAKIEEYRKEINVCKWMMVSIVGLLSGVIARKIFLSSIDECNALLSKYRNIQQKFSFFQINVLEAHFMGETQYAYPSLEKRIKVVRLMSAFALSEDDAHTLNKWATEIFKSKFVPNHILDLFAYEKSHGFTLLDDDRQKILRKMRKRDLQNGALQLGQAPRMNAVREARIKAVTSYLFVHTTIGFAYQKSKIEPVARRFVVGTEVNPHLTLEEVLRNSPLYHPEL